MERSPLSLKCSKTIKEENLSTLSAGEPATPKATLSQPKHHTTTMTQREVRGRERCHVSFMDPYQIAKSVWKIKVCCQRDQV
jgi:hypothetical protein